MELQIILKYLADLSENNNREWYHAHKAENKAANAEFEALIQALILNIGKFDSSVINNEPKNLTFILQNAEFCLIQICQGHWSAFCSRVIQQVKALSSIN